MAVEFSPLGLKSNVIQAGLTETPSLKMISGSDKLIETGVKRNPLGRMTKPEDVANVVYLLCTDEAAWINGALIHVDGGEHCC
jgi:enoyl-[acyl-carrier-protein] reductase (NADH)